MTDGGAGAYRWYSRRMAINPGRILHVDDALLAVHKLSGELVVRGKGPIEKLPLLDFLRKDYPGVRPLHRLDFETSGVVVFSRRKDVLASVVESKFAGWTKVYRAILMGDVQRREGEISTPLPSRETKELVPAHTRYKVLERLHNATYVEAVIEKGRHHQLRRHFASIGHALALDTVYGNDKFNRSFTRKYRFKRFFLHAYSVTLPHPLTGERLTITAPMPSVFEEALERIRRTGRE